MDEDLPAEGRPPFRSSQLHTAKPAASAERQGPAKGVSPCGTPGEAVLRISDQTVHGHSNVGRVRLEPIVGKKKKGEKKKKKGGGREAKPRHATKPEKMTIHKSGWLVG